MTDVQNLQSALHMIISIRAKTAEIMKCAADGMTTKHGEDGKEMKFLSELKLQLDTITSQMKELVIIWRLKISKARSLGSESSRQNHNLLSTKKFVILNSC